MTYLTAEKDTFSKFENVLTILNYKSTHYFLKLQFLVKYASTYLQHVHFEICRTARKF